MRQPKVSTQISNAVYVSSLIGDALMAVKLSIMAQMVSLSRNASGDSVRSLTIETAGVDGILWGKRSFRFMEQGRGRGSIPHDFTTIILNWATAKGVNLHYKGNPAVKRSERRSAAWLIAQKIKSEGTKLYRDRRTDDIFTSIIDKKIDELSGKIMMTASSDIDRITDIL